MPLFICSNCKCVENTALGDYWYRVDIKNLPPLCSECSDDRDNTWHGQFEKEVANEEVVRKIGIENFCDTHNHLALIGFDSETHEMAAHLKRRRK